MFHHETGRSGGGWHHATASAPPDLWGCFTMKRVNLAITRMHALRVSSLVGDAGKPEYRFSEREGWHLGTPTPRPQETGWHSLRPQGPRRRLGVVVADGTGLHRDHPPGTRCTFSRAPGGVVRPPRPPTVPAPPVPVGGSGGHPPPMGYRSSCSV